MVLSTQGQAILARIYSNFRINYLERYPGSNGNDIERAFLNEVLEALADVVGCPLWVTKPEEKHTIDQLIDALR